MKVFLLLHFWMATLFLNAQTTKYFTKLFDKNEHRQSFDAGVITHDGNFLLVADNKGTAYPHRHLWLLTLDENGDTIQPSTIFAGDSADLFVGSNLIRYDFGQDKGYYFPIGQKDWSPIIPNTGEAELYKVGADLKIIWKKNLGGSHFETFEAIAMTSKNELIMAGHSTSFDDPYYPNGLVVKTDTAGTVIWQKSIGFFGKHDSFHSIDTTSDGGVILAGIHRDAPMNDDIHVIKLDSWGDQVWRKEFGGTSLDVYNSPRIRTLSNGDFLLTGGLQPFGKGPEATIIRISASGVTLYEKTYPGNGGWSYFDLSSELADGNSVTIGGTRELDSASTVWPNIATLTKTDAAGNLLWQRTFFESVGPYHTFNGLLPTADGGFLMYGTGFRMNNNKQDSWAVKVDSLGCLEPGCATVPTEELSPKSVELSIFPNPANDWVQIESPSADLLGFRLMDVSGRVLEDLQFYRADAVRLHRVSLKGQPTGPLSLSIRTSAGWSTRIVLKE